MTKNKKSNKKLNNKNCICECNECQKNGIWEIHIRKPFHGEYGKKIGLYCTHCLEEELDGIHTGGGLTDYCIQKIIRKTND